MALREPRSDSKFKIGWHRGDPEHERTPYDQPQWWAEIGGVKVATAVMTGRSGVDDYPWDWSLTDNGRGMQTHPGRTFGVEDTLRSVKQYVYDMLKPRS